MFCSVWFKIYILREFEHGLKRHFKPPKIFVILQYQAVCTHFWENCYWNISHATWVFHPLFLSDNKYFKRVVFFMWTQWIIFNWWCTFWNLVILVIGFCSLYVCFVVLLIDFVLRVILDSHVNWVKNTASYIILPCSNLQLCY